MLILFPYLCAVRYGFYGNRSKRKRKNRRKAALRCKRNKRLLSSLVIIFPHQQNTRVVVAASPQSVFQDLPRYLGSIFSPLTNSYRCLISSHHTVSSEQGIVGHVPAAAPLRRPMRYDCSCNEGRSTQLTVPRLSRNPGQLLLVPLKRLSQTMKRSPPPLLRSSRRMLPRSRI